MDTTLTEGLEIVQQLKAVVHNKLAVDDGLMTAWLRASRTESRHSRSVSAPTPVPLTPDSSARANPATSAGGPKRSRVDDNSKA